MKIRKATQYESDAESALTAFNLSDYAKTEEEVAGLVDASFLEGMEEARQLCLMEVELSECAEAAAAAQRCADVIRKHVEARQ